MSDIKSIIGEEINNHNKRLSINEQEYKVYHGTNEKFNKFDPKKSTMGGIIWFTDSIDSIKTGQHGGAGNKIIMTRYITINNPAGWDEYDKYGLGQLEDMGYDGIILPHGTEYNDYVVFDTKNIRKGNESEIDEITKRYDDSETQSTYQANFPSFGDRLDLNRVETDNTPNNYMDEIEKNLLDLL